MGVQSEENKSLYLSGEPPERDCDTEELRLIVKSSGTERRLLGQRIHTTQQFPRVQH